jgi:glutathione S-transferase
MVNVALQMRALAGKDSMKLYDGGRAPNPRRVRIYLAEKGIIVPTEAVDLGNMQHKGPDFTAINPLQRVPVLVLVDGTVITESVAICRYFEAQNPDPSLFGRTPLEIATIEMWNRRIELSLYGPVQAVFRHLNPNMNKFEVPQIAQWGEANKSRAMDFLAVLDAQLARYRFIAGDAFSIADISGLVTVDLMKPAKLAVDDRLVNVTRWYDDVNSRPSAKA